MKSQWWPSVIVMDGSVISYGGEGEEVSGIKSSVLVLDGV